MKKIPQDEYEKALEGLKGWKKAEAREAIVKTYHFEDFNEAFGWMTRVAMIAEKMDHHPEWSNIYNSVDVVLTTHDAKGLTEKDLFLARMMERCCDI